MGLRQVEDEGSAFRTGASNGHVAELGRSNGLVDRADDGDIVLCRIAVAIVLLKRLLFRLGSETDDNVDARHVGRADLRRVDDEARLVSAGGHKGLRLIDLLRLITKLDAEVLGVGVVEQVNLLVIRSKGVDDSGGSRHGDVVWRELAVTWKCYYGRMGVVWIRCWVLALLRTLSGIQRATVAQFISTETNNIRGQRQSRIPRASIMSQYTPSLLPRIVAALAGGERVDVNVRVRRRPGCCRNEGGSKIIGRADSTARRCQPLVVAW